MCQSDEDGRKNMKKMLLSGELTYLYIENRVGVGKGHGLEIRGGKAWEVCPDGKWYKVKLVNVCRIL